MTQYKSPAITKIAAQIIAPRLQRINVPKTPIMIHARIENKQPSRSSASTSPKSKLLASDTPPEPGFLKLSILSKKFPRLSLSFQPLYKPVVMKVKKISERIVVERIALK